MVRASRKQVVTTDSHPHADIDGSDSAPDLVADDLYADLVVDDPTLDAFTAADEEFAARCGVDYLSPTSRDEAMLRYVTALRNRDMVVARIKSTEKEYRALARRLEEDKSMKVTLDTLLDPAPRLF